MAKGAKLTARVEWDKVPILDGECVIERERARVCVWERERVCV